MALYTKRRKQLEFSGEWLDAFGKPEAKGSWIVWGDSFNGKTSFICMLAKYLTKFGRVVYNSLEEGDSVSMTQAFRRVQMEEVRKNILLLDREELFELRSRLEGQKAPRFVIIDSVQYFDITQKSYKHLLKDFPDTLFIWVSHEENKLPAGRTARAIRYDSFVKIRVEGYKAFVNSRYRSGKGEFVIWKEGADKYYGTQF